MLLGPSGWNDAHRNGRAELDAQVRHGRMGQAAGGPTTPSNARPVSFSMPLARNLFSTILCRGFGVVA